MLAFDCWAVRLSLTAVEGVLAVPEETRSRSPSPSTSARATELKSTPWRIGILSKAKAESGEAWPIVFS